MKLTITLDKDRAKELKHFAEEAGITVEETALRAVDDFLQLCEVLEDESNDKSHDETDISNDSYT